MAFPTGNVHKPKRFPLYILFQGVFKTPWKTVACKLLPGQGVCEECCGPPPPCHVGREEAKSSIQTHPLPRNVSKLDANACG